MNTRKDNEFMVMINVKLYTGGFLYPTTTKLSVLVFLYEDM